MGADIENPDPDGCVAAAEPSRNTFKGRLAALFLRNPNGAGGGDADDKAAKPPNGGGGTVANVAAAKPPLPYQCGWRNCVLYVYSAIFFLVAFSSTYPQRLDDEYGIKDRQHTVLACIGFPVGMILSVSFLFAAIHIGAEQR